MKVNINDVWEQYEKMLRKIAWGLAKRHGKGIDDLLSEGWLGVVGQVARWDPERSSLTTWVYRTAYFRMLNYCLGHGGLRAREHQDVDPLAEILPDSQSYVSSLLQELSDEARVLVGVILEAPGELAGEIAARAPVRSRNSVTRYLIDDCDWRASEVQRAWEEVEASIAP